MKTEILTSIYFAIPKSQFDIYQDAELVYSESMGKLGKTSSKSEDNIPDNVEKRIDITGYQNKMVPVKVMSFAGKYDKLDDKVRELIYQISKIKSVQDSPCVLSMHYKKSSDEKFDCDFSINGKHFEKKKVSPRWGKEHLSYFYKRTIEIAFDFTRKIYDSSLSYEFKCLCLHTKNNFELLNAANNIAVVFRKRIEFDGDDLVVRDIVELPTINDERQDTFIANSPCDVTSRISAPVDEIGAVLIHGYTNGLFGHYDKHRMIDNKTSLEMKRNLELIKTIHENGGNIYIECDKETEQYYKILTKCCVLENCKINNGALNAFKKLELRNGMKKLTIANPPYNAKKGGYKKILRDDLEWSDEIVFVSPLGYIYDDEDDAETIRKMISEYYTEITLINPKTYFNANAVGFAGFTHIDKTKKSRDIVTSIDGIEGSVTHHSLEDITGYASFSPVFKPLYELSNHLIEECGSISDYTLSSHEDLERLAVTDADKEAIASKIHSYPHCRHYQGQSDRNKFITVVSKSNGNKNYMTSDKEFCFIPNKWSSSVMRYGDFLDNWFAMKTNERQLYYIAHENEDEANNCNKLFKTDFFRMFLLIAKKNIYLYDLTGHVPTAYVPSMKTILSDKGLFMGTIRQIDDKLFKRYNVSDELRKEVRNVLADVYGIR